MKRGVEDKEVPSLETLKEELRNLWEIGGIKYIARGREKSQWAKKIKVLLKANLSAERVNEFNHLIDALNTAIATAQIKGYQKEANDILAILTLKSLSRLTPDIVAAIQACTKPVKHLYLNGNKLQAIPAEIGQLQALEILDLSGNQLKTLPAEMGELKMLEELNLSNNQLRSLPAEMKKLVRLSVLSVHPNPWNKQILEHCGWITWPFSSQALVQAFFSCACPNQVKVPKTSQLAYTPLLHQANSDSWEDYLNLELSANDNNPVKRARLMTPRHWADM